jgi:hypothetical protein
VVFPIQEVCDGEWLVMKDMVTSLDLALLVSVKQSSCLPQWHLKCLRILAVCLTSWTLAGSEGSKLRLWRLRRHLRSRCCGPGRTLW